MIELSIAKAYKLATKAMDNYLFNLAFDAERSKKKKVYISEIKYDEIIRKQEEREKKDKILSDTVYNNNKGIKYEKEGRLKLAIKYYEKNLIIGYTAHHAYDRLRILYRKQKDWVNVERVIRRKAEVFGYGEEQTKAEIARYCKASIKMETHHEAVYPASRLECVVNGDKMGRKINRIQSMFPEFDFYTRVLVNDAQVNDELEDYTTADRIIQENYTLIRQLKALNDTVKRQLDKAKDNERQGRLDLACSIYEELVYNEVENTEPYKRLIAIYKKAKLADAYLSILKQSVTFFSSVLSRRLEYIKELMGKYGVIDINGVKLSECKSISYYNGAFILYKKYREIAIWKSEIKKIADK